MNALVLVCAIVSVVAGAFSVWAARRIVVEVRFLRAILPSKPGAPPTPALRPATAEEIEAALGVDPRVSRGNPLRNPNMQAPPENMDRSGLEGDE